MEQKNKMILLSVVGVFLFINVIVQAVDKNYFAAFLSFVIAIYSFVRIQQKNRK